MQIVLRALTAQLQEGALAFEAAGGCAIGLEAIPEAVALRITERVILATVRVSPAGSTPTGLHVLERLP